MLTRDEAIKQVETRLEYLLERSDLEWESFKKDYLSSFTSYE